MRKIWLIVIVLMMAGALRAQQIKIYGRAVAGGKPIPGVMVLVFERNHFYKRFVTDRKGEFRFAVGAQDYVILFYKPGMLPESYHVINHMETDVLKIPVYMEMAATTMDPDSVLVHSPLLSQAHPDVASAYVKAIYDYERRRHDTIASSTRRTLMSQAIAERRRFADYKRTTTPRTTRDSTERTTTTIGPDTYTMLTDEKGAKRYFKNDKPITETTYLFETTRRYEGVLKNKRDVRRFEKYQPMEHVKPENK